ncbi:TMEM175 family protein (plasmid) [Rhizobium sp. CB3090]|uniref:TMEM175 family protein n=1 Tax=Rhizobium sp. CB3090 TaxID=3039156 RepID=UPI0024B076FD|nr:TMEM175 family protein [Rhizobium sp. CB3090]WFU11255.1 TMEM175 family protein [Rhizobium sp. CB3090]
MVERKPTAERLSLFSDGIFAIIITILVLELRPPHEASFTALKELWPEGLSYAVSYWFLAVVWINHHHVLRFAESATPRLIWSNFAHLFSVSLIPFTTAWIADSDLGSAPVTLYALVFAAVNVTYLAICWEAVDRPSDEHPSDRIRRMMRMRSLVTIVLFLAAALIAIWSLALGLGIIVFCLLLYVRPDVSEVST